MIDSKREVFPPLRRKRSPFKSGVQGCYYLSASLHRAIADVARARQVSQSELISTILESDQEIAAQMALYEALEQ